ncbi:MAG: hypothetical protein VYE14_01335 [Verrucomicrobiota bacterium]|nr:hypothetical protein [Verrucomicrobiota bacterium]
MEPATEIPKADELFDLRQKEHAELFQSLGQAEIRGNVFIGEGAVIESGALVQGPVWVRRNCRIGHGATLATT